MEAAIPRKPLPTDLWTRVWRRAGGGAWDVFHSGPACILHQKLRGIHYGSALAALARPCRHCWLLEANERDRTAPGLPSRRSAGLGG